MSTLMEDDIKRWTAKRKTALILDIRKQCERPLADLQSAYGEAMLE